MEIDPGLKKETLSSDRSGHNIGATSPVLDLGDIRAGSLPSHEGDDSLTLLPEVQATGRPAGSKRPFQRRRRSRACDACRARKTKCDTPDHGPCSACVSASLVCRFSGGEDRRRAGPARRVRALESTVQELTRKLAEAELRSQHIGLSSSEAGSLTEKSPNSPMTTSTGLGITPKSPRFSSSSSNKDLGVPKCPHSSSYGESADYGGAQKERERGGELYQEDGTSWDHHIFGPSSCPSFLHSYSDYLSRLGYRPPPASDPTLGGGPLRPNPNMRIPNLNARIQGQLTPNKFLPLDLRALLPPIKLARQMFEVFRKTVQNYTPIFYWPSLEKKIERAWGMPIWDGDNEAVRSVFCVIVMLLAVASQFIEPGELNEPEGGDWAHVQERNGWMFFEFGRKYSNLNNPDYTIDDAIYLLLMAFYLDKASLPSPCWMITGAMARVCQDIGIYRRTPNGLYNNIEIESRTRLFWAAYIQDRKISMKLGRPVIFRDQHIDVGLPGLPGVGGKQEEGNTTQGSLGGQSGTDAANSPGVASMEDRRNGFGDESRNSLEVFKATIYIAKTSEELLNISLKQNGGPEDIKHLQAIDEMLKKAWEIFPMELTNLSRKDVLDLPAVRPLFHLQHSRIILYRYFTDFTGSPVLLRDFRTFCLAQSIQVAKITSHIIFRVSQNADFDRIFGLRTDELVFIHTFRAATVLLLGHYCHDRSLLSVSAEEVDVCARALRSTARSHYLGQKLLKLFEDFAKMFGYQIGLVGAQPIPDIAGGDDIDEKPEVLHATPTPTNPWNNPPPGNTIPSPQYTNIVYGEYNPPNGNTRWIPATSAPLSPPNYQQLLHSGQDVPPPHQQHHHHAHSGLIFIDPAMGGGGLPTAVAGGVEDPVAEDRAPLPHPIDWDMYQQILTFDPNFQVYMGGSINRHFLYDRE